MTLGQLAAKLSLLPRMYRELDREHVALTFVGDDIVLEFTGSPDLPGFPGFPILRCVGNTWHIMDTDQKRIAEWHTH